MPASRTAPNGHVYFPYYLDIEPREAGASDSQRYISGIADLMSKLRLEYGSGNVVASCDFEEQLSDEERRLCCALFKSSVPVVP
jgi:hypothetical protein